MLLPRLMAQDQWLLVESLRSLWCPSSIVAQPHGDWQISACSSITSHRPQTLGRLGALGTVLHLKTLLFVCCCHCVSFMYLS